MVTLGAARGRASGHASGRASGHAATSGAPGAPGGPTPDSVVAGPLHPPGTELAPGYRVISHLNRGRRMDVYDAWSEERESRCVLKTLRPDRAAEARADRALLREGRLLTRFTHPHLVRAYEITRTLHGDHPVLVLETLGGETLSHLVHRLEEMDRRLPLTEVAMLGLQLGSALSYLHRHGWLHLDLKPANIVADGGRARLIDLSVARRPGRARAGIGTLEYMAPEQAAGGLLAPAADVWGLGAVLDTALTGEPPYGYGDDTVDEDTSSQGDAGDGSQTSDSDTDLGSPATYPQLVGDPPSVRRRRRLPSALADLVDACLQREPAQRPALSEVTDELDGWLATRLGQRVRY
jgi:eukaryotic-like serine/threonine-protein kinase